MQAGHPAAPRILRVPLSIDHSPFWCPLASIRWVGTSLSRRSLARWMRHPFGERSPAFWAHGRGTSRDWVAAGTETRALTSPPPPQPQRGSDGQIRHPKRHPHPFLLIVEDPIRSQSDLGERRPHCVPAKRRKRRRKLRAPSQDHSPFSDSRPTCSPVVPNRDETAQYVPRKAAPDRGTRYGTTLHLTDLAAGDRSFACPHSGHGRPAVPVRS
jgi:hypothetical protein